MKVKGDWSLVTEFCVVIEVESWHTARVARFFGSEAVVAHLGHHVVQVDYTWRAQKTLYGRGFELDQAQRKELGGQL